MVAILCDYYRLLSSPDRQTKPRMNPSKPSQAVFLMRRVNILRTVVNTPETRNPTSTMAIAKFRCRLTALLSNHIMYLFLHPATIVYYDDYAAETHTPRSSPLYNANGGYSLPSFLVVCTVRCSSQDGGSEHFH
jgi:hypothetical protein